MLNLKKQFGWKNKKWEITARLVYIENAKWVPEIVDSVYHPENLVGKYFLITKWDNQGKKLIFKESSKNGEDYFLYHYGAKESERMHIDVSQQEEWERLQRDLGLQETTNWNGNNLNKEELLKEEQKNLLNQKIKKICKSEKPIILNNLEDIYDLELNKSGQVVKIILSFTVSKARTNITWEDAKWLEWLNYLEWFGDLRELHLTLENIKKIFWNKDEFFLYSASENKWVQIKKLDWVLYAVYKNQNSPLGSYRTGKIIVNDLNKNLPVEQSLVVSLWNESWERSAFQLKVWGKSHTANESYEVGSTLQNSRDSIDWNSRSIFEEMRTVRNELHQVFADLAVFSNKNEIKQSETFQVLSDQAHKIVSDFNALAFIPNLDLEKLKAKGDLKIEAELMPLRHRLLDLANRLEYITKNRAEIINNINLVLDRAQGTWKEVYQSLADANVRKIRILDFLSQLKKIKDPNLEVEIEKVGKKSVKLAIDIYAELLTQVNDEIQRIEVYIEDFQAYLILVEKHICTYLAPYEINPEALKILNQEGTKQRKHSDEGVLLSVMQKIFRIKESIEDRFWGENE